MENDAFKSLMTDLRSSIVDLETVHPWIGFWRFWSLGLIVLGFITLAWTTDQPILFFAYTAIAGVFYAFWFICTHDAVHHTLTGWAWFDNWMPCLLAYPMMWTHRVYAHLHGLHHGWNGVNLQDPERVQWTITEYEQASPWVQWYVRHQWAIDLLVLGGWGMIIKTVIKAIRLGHQIPILHRLLLWDGLGILIAQTMLVVIAIWHHRLLDYLLFWLVLERTIGVIVQARDHLEHYGLWGKSTGHQLTQLYASRNLNTPSFVTWLMGGLNYHAIHHAFPQIPFDQLPEAFDRIQTILQRYQLPEMTIGDGYVRETWRLSRHPRLIHSS